MKNLTVKEILELNNSTITIKEFNKLSKNKNVYGTELFTDGKKRGYINLFKINGDSIDRYEIKVFIK